MIAGRYDLQHEIGRGGMGVVWLARDELLGRSVAIKRIATGAASDPSTRRAQREARLAATLNHPHVVSVLDLVIEGDEQWLVMEYVDGVTLTELVRRHGPLSPDGAAAIFARVADALAAAHAQQIVHRDVKPSNILVGADGLVKLSDFGIARSTGDESLTQTGMLIGSPAYLAPEVATGSVATAASDVWSLGAALYLALTGSPAYESDGHVLATLHRIVNDPPPRPPQAGWLAPLLEGAMTVDPTARWPMSRVREFLATGPAGALPETTQELPAPVEPPRRRTPLLALAGTLAVLLAALGVWALVGDGDGSDPGVNSPSGSSSSSTSATPGARATAAGMQDFVRTYVATATTDQQASWQMLTPSFQDESGNFGQYQKGWRSRPVAEVSNIVADPETLTVRYDVTYRDAQGNKLFDDSPTLQLVLRDGTYLIDGEV
ncbi:serine/threonine-protein kinase [Nocardioides sp.]|uniref:serine/threonine-protein kinase n=1 Tax=Nocardioides sp. TaxID=35761 RepID=UPI003D0A0081